MGKFLEGLGEQFGLAVRQLAWLNTAPRDERKVALTSRAAEEPVSRLKQMQADGIEPMMPPVPPAPYLDWLLELGPTEAAGMGVVAVGWRTIDAWCSRTGVDLAPWEARLLRRLSGEWLAESDRARKPDCPAPWGGETVEGNRAAVAAKVGAALKALAQRRGRFPVGDA